MTEENKDKATFGKFYLFGTIIWVLLIIFYGLGKYYISLQTAPPTTNLAFLDEILGIIVLFGIFGIPIIFGMSFFVRLAEFVINKIPSKHNK